MSIISNPTVRDYERSKYTWKETESHDACFFFAVSACQSTDDNHRPSSHRRLPRLTDSPRHNGDAERRVREHECRLILRRPHRRCTRCERLWTWPPLKFVVRKSADCTPVQARHARRPKSCRGSDGMRHASSASFSPVIRPPNRISLRLQQKYTSLP